MQELRLQLAQRPVRLQIARDQATRELNACNRVNHLKLRGLKPASAG